MTEAVSRSSADLTLNLPDLADAIESGAYSEWEFGVQVMPDTDDQTFEGIDLLDPTKFVPEELTPVQVIGTLTLNANTLNYFAETSRSRSIRRTWCPVST